MNTVASAVKEGLDYLTGLIDRVEYSFMHGNVDILWDTVREAPMTVAFGRNDFIVQMIDEFLKHMKGGLQELKLVVK